jgi:hypothetical protein
LSVLEAIGKSLCCDRWLKARLRRLREAEADSVWEIDEEKMIFGCLALLLYRLSSRDMISCQKRLKLGRESVKYLGEVASIKKLTPGLERSQPASVLFRWLSPYSTEALLVVWAAEKKGVRRQIRRYQAELRDVRTLLDGRHIIERYGLKPSPLIGRLLNELRDARLDGRVETQEDEERLLGQLLIELTNSGGDTKWARNTPGRRK